MVGRKDDEWPPCNGSPKSGSSSVMALDPFSLALFEVGTPLSRCFKARSTSGMIKVELFFFVRNS